MKLLEKVNLESSGWVACGAWVKLNGRLVIPFELLHVDTTGRQDKLRRNEEINPPHGEDESIHSQKRVVIGLCLRVLIQLSIDIVVIIAVK